MMEHTEGRKPQTTAKMKTRFCNSKKTEKVHIPSSWELNEKQKSFIESLLDEKQK